MTADALAVTGNANLAQERLAVLAYNGDDLAQVAAAVERLAADDEASGDAAAAVRLRLLAQAVDLPAAATPAVEETASPLPLVFAPNWLAVGGLAIFVATAVLVLWSVLRRRKGGAPEKDGSLFDEYAAGVSGAAPTEPGPGPQGRPAGSQDSARGGVRPDGDTLTTPLAPSPHYPPAHVAPPLEPVAGDEADDLLDEVEDEATPLPEETYADIDIDVERLGADEPAADMPSGDEPAGGTEDAEWDDLTAAIEADQTLPDDREAAAETDADFESLLDADREPGAVEDAEDFDLDQIEFLRPVEAAPEPSQPPVENEVPPDALGVFEAEYRYGDDDFDCSFSIEAEGAFLGECGVGVSEVLGFDGSQRVAALEVWVFDKGDIRTVSKLLVSEFVAHDEALESRLSAKGDLVVGAAGRGADPGDPGPDGDGHGACMQVPAGCRTAR